MSINACLIGGGRKAPMIHEALESLPEPPNVLLVPSACSVPASYDKKVPAHVQTFRDLGVPVEVLHAFGETPTVTERAEKFGRASLIFTIPGNSPHMLRLLEEHGTGQDISAAAANGTMLAGSSAGGLLPFAVGHSNPSAKKGAEFEYTMLPMLGLIPAAAAMHAKVIDPPKTISRLEDFAGRFPEAGQDYGLAIENNAGLLIVGKEARIVRSEPDANIHFLEQNDGQVFCQTISDDPHMLDVIHTIYANT